MQAPKEFDYDDERFIDEGSSKMVWRLDEFAVINAYDRQRFHGLKGSEEEMIQKSNRTISMEYNFTLYLNGIFPALIPRVYLFKDPYPFEDNRFRYVKDFCPPVVNDEGLFDKLIKVSDTLLEQGWVYLDIKPENLSEKNGQLSIVDTDYKSLYKVPEHMIPDFRKWVYMIVLIYTYNYITIIDPKTLIEFIKKKGIDSMMMRELRPKFSIDHWKKISKEIIEYGNKSFREKKVGDYIQLTKIFDPYLFFEAYGTKNEEAYYIRFSKLMKLANAEAPAEAPAQAPAEAKGEAPAKAPAEATAETTPEAPVKAPAQAPAKGPVEAPAEAKAETTAKAQAPAETTPEATAKAPAEAPAETTPEAKDKAPAQAPAETTPEEPVETTAQAPAETTPEATAKAPAEAPVEATAQEKAKRPIIGSRAGIGAGAKGEAKKGPIPADRPKLTPRRAILVHRAKPEDNAFLQPNPIAEPKGKSPERTLPNDETVAYKQEDDVVPINKQNTVLTKKIKGVGNQKTKKGNPPPTPKDRRRKVPVKLNV